MGLRRSTTPQAGTCERRPEPERPATDANLRSTLSTLVGELLDLLKKAKL
jgi:hypothetical protein